eukprot:1157067-Pelagomonas_calceolata.AAC.10
MGKIARHGGRHNMGRIAQLKVVTSCMSKPMHAGTQDKVRQQDRGRGIYAVRSSWCLNSGMLKPLFMP